MSTIEEHGHESFIRYRLNLGLSYEQISEELKSYFPGVVIALQ